MYGAILGDIIGSPYEFDRGNKTKEFTLFHPHAKYTDDTVMTVAVADALMCTMGDSDEDIRETLIDSMHNWGHKYLAFKNYRIFDMAAWDIKNYLMEPASDSTDTQKTVESAGNPEEKGSIETQVNERVREEFMRQIREKKAALADLDLKRENLLREISLLEDMLLKLQR